MANMLQTMPDLERDRELILYAVMRQVGGRVRIHADNLHEIMTAHDMPRLNIIQVSDPACVELWITGSPDRIVSFNPPPPPQPLAPVFVPDLPVADKSGKRPTLGKHTSRWPVVTITGSMGVGKTVLANAIREMIAKSNLPYMPDAVIVDDPFADQIASTNHVAVRAGSEYVAPPPPPKLAPMPKPRDPTLGEAWSAFAKALGRATRLDKFAAWLSGEPGK